MTRTCLRHVHRLALIAIGAWSGSALGIDEAELKRLVKDDAAIEYASCGAYFIFAAEGMRRSLPEGPARDKEVADWMRSSGKAFQLADTLGSPEKTKAIAQMTLENIKRKTNASYENWAIAAAEYGYVCKDAMDEPAKRMRYWQDLERSRQ